MSEDYKHTVTLMADDPLVYFMGGWCSNNECPCWDPGLPCEEFMGPGLDLDDLDKRCPRCSWSEAAHGRDELSD